jgi:hypothetical protein
MLARCLTPRMMLDRRRKCLERLGHSQATGAVSIDAIRGTDQVALPRSSHVSLTGLASGRPRLSLSLIAAPNALAIKSFSIKLPPGITFNKNRRQLSHGLRISGQRSYTFK